ncbi:hypothetical protein ELI01_18725 [Rhizobium leguminosarum]|uniref:phage adaptor protein n=1 Tax=Rhizobium leguminosarum TaxID=384 RepID=UPI001031F07F|nr:hypothetical protein [Rhizobium leguminosarum]TAX57116.1 hypothetical protein ELI01_18725 [Rhizobium leguminosarum]
MVAFADYLDLRVAVAEHVGNRNISDVMPRLVQMAESTLNQKLRHREQITSDTLTFTAGVSLLPADFLEMINVFGLYGAAMRAGSLADVNRSGSEYSRYAIDGSDILIYGVSGDRDITYFAKIPTLTTSVSTTNWLLASYPSVYLYAVGLEAAKFLRDMELAQATQGLLAQALNDMKVDDDRARWANATVRIQMVTP